MPTPDRAASEAAHAHQMDTQGAIMATGKALYGDRWQTDLARAMGFNDGRRVRQWLSGDRPVPGDLRAKLKQLVLDRQRELSQTLEKL